MEIDALKDVRLEKLEKLRSKGSDPYGSRFVLTSSVAQVLNNFTEGQEVVLAGRVMASRNHGKVYFLDLMDQTGRMQLFVKADNLSARIG